MVLSCELPDSVNEALAVAVDDANVQQLEEQLQLRPANAHGDMNMLTITTIYEDSKHDWSYIFATLEAILHLVRQHLLHINGVWVQSDNASNYHGPSPACCLRPLSMANGITIH